MKIGFIGSGNMGSAIIGGMLNAKITDAKNITVSDINSEGLKKVKDRYCVNTTNSNTELSKESDIIFLCVKPNVLETVVLEIRDSIKNDTVIVSIAAGKSIKSIEEMFKKQVKLIRVMPNTPALVGEGMSAVSINDNITDSEKDTVLKILRSFGKSEVVMESLMDTVTAVSGSSPAYVFMLIEAMADAAVLGGMPRSQAYTFAAQAVLGSAKMVLETGTHPGELKDMVCSPSGTTIEAVAVLEEKGMRSAVMEAMDACIRKSKEMGKN